MEPIIGLVILVLLSVYRRRRALQRTKRTRRYSVRYVNRRRSETSIIKTLVEAAIKHDHEYFFKFLRMTPDQFFELYRKVSPHISDRRRTRITISTMDRLIMTVHYIAEGCSMQEIAFVFFLGKSTVSQIIPEVAKAIHMGLKQSELKPPSKQRFKEIEEDFWNLWNMPNCLGATDGKHVRVTRPKKSGSLFFNYKKFFSIVLMATCDARYIFTMVDVGAYGGISDGAVFKESGFGQALLNKTLDMPGPKRLPGSKTVLPHFVVADAAFPLHENIMKPYGGDNLGENKSIFNYRLSRARRCIENAFGILTQRWRIFLTAIDLQVETTEYIILAAIVLHNYLQRKEKNIPSNKRMYCPIGFADEKNSNGRVTPGQWRRMESQKSCLKPIPKIQISRQNQGNTLRNKNNRDQLTDFFVSPEGSVPWQWSYVLRGSVPNSFRMDYF